MMNELKAASIIAGRASQTNSNMMRENDETTAVKQPAPELLESHFDTLSFPR